jgi:hypothetical protein
LSLDAIERVVIWQTWGEQMPNHDAPEEALRVLGSNPLDAASLADIKDMSSRIRTAVDIMSRVGLTYGASQQLGRARRLADAAENRTGLLKGVMLYQAITDLFVAISEAAMA